MNHGFGKCTAFTATMLFGALQLLAAASALAENSTAVRTDIARAASLATKGVTTAISPGESHELILGAAPREDEDEARALYGPLADYLGKALGRKVVFKPAGSWGAYQGLMQKGAYDLVFDGPHFNAWRIDRTQHNVLVKVPGEHVFVVVVRKENDKVRELRQLAGRTLCGHAPPNLGTLTALNEFDNPARQPLIVNIDGWKEIHQGLLAGKCVAAVLPLKQLEKFEKDSTQTRIVFRGRTLPDNALSASPRVTAADREKIVRALISPEGELATARLRQKYAAGRPLAVASNQEFAGLGHYLQNEWGF